MGDFDRNFDRRGSSRGGFGRDRPRFGGRDRGGDRGGFDSGDRGRFGGRDRGRDRRSERHEMHEAVCDKCGKDCEVPFRPTEGKPVYCDDCFKSKSREAGSRSEMGKPKNNETFDQLHKKLDRILKILEEPIIEKEEPVEEKEKSKSIEKKEPELEYAKSEEEKKPKKKKAKKKES